MLNRVRLGDLLLAVLGLAGLCAGLALTITKLLGVTGPVLVGVGIVAAAAAIMPGARSQVSQILRRQSQQEESLAAVLAVPIQQVEEVDPFTIGVFHSVLAEEAGLGRSVLAEGPDAIPPYVSRKVDAALRKALQESCLAQSGRLVVLRGDPKSGKSRSLWEGVRTMSGRRLVAVAQPDPAAASTDPAFAPLATLAGLDRPVSKSRGRDLVIWVDDAHTHLQRGLTRNTLRQLAGLYPAAVIAMTIHAHELNGLRDIDPPLHALLRRPFDELLLASELSLSELASARSAYPSLADNSDLERLAELLAAVNLLIDRYQSHRADQPAGVAVAKAAIDWQRAGMPPGSIDEPTLRSLGVLTLAGIVPNQDLDDRAFKRGLDWASEEVAAFAALVRREPVGGGQVRRFRAFDGVVSWAEQNADPLDSQTWDFVLARADDSDLLKVGIAAYTAAEWETATRAFHRCAAITADSSLAALALIVSGFTLVERGRYRDAITEYEQVIDLFSTVEDPALAQRVAMALVGKGDALSEMGQPSEAIAAYDRVADCFDTSEDPALAEQVARALVSKATILHHLDKAMDALVIYDQVIERFGTAQNPALAEQVARALISKGETEGELDRTEEEVAAYQIVIERFRNASDPDLAKEVARAMVKKGDALGAMGRTDEQIATYDNVILQYEGSEDSNIGDEVAKARLFKETTLNDLDRSSSESAVYSPQVLERIRAGDLALAKAFANQLFYRALSLQVQKQHEDAIAQYDDMIKLFGDTADPILLDFVGMSLLNAGSELGQLGRHDQQLARYDEIVDRLGGIDNATLADLVAMALVSKGETLTTVGRHQDAILAFDQVIDRLETGHFSQDYELAQALLGKGLALAELRRPEDAIAAFDEVINRSGRSESPNLEHQVANALLNKGLQLGRLARPDQERAAYDQVIQRFTGTKDPGLADQVAKAIAYKDAR